MTKQRLAVGFADLEHYHKYVVAYGGEAAVELLRESYTLAGDIIVAHGGRIIKYIGDSILFVLEDPNKAETVARAIVGCFRKEAEGGVVRFNVSIATGDVYLTEIGHPSLVTSDIFGETVNNAALGIREAGRRPEKYIIRHNS